MFDLSSVSFTVVARGGRSRGAFRKNIMEIASVDTRHAWHMRCN
jgi:hypothetical protein